jgi:hypothetical protein
MYRRSVSRSDCLLPHAFVVLENNVLLCDGCVTVVGASLRRRDADEMVFIYPSKGL